VGATVQAVTELTRLRAALQGLSEPSRHHDRLDHQQPEIPVMTTVKRGLQQDRPPVHGQFSPRP
jgi:hypothetical protein